MGLFLAAAESILRDWGKPMSSDDLTKLFIERKVFLTEGKTPENTMRARLSEELRKNGLNSVFQRVGKNRFALREWRRKEYIAPEFVKAIPAENLVCFDSSHTVFSKNELNGIFPITTDLMALLRNRDEVKVIPRLKAEQNESVKQLVSYVFMKSEDGRILTYIRGKYSSAHETLLRGRHSLGFGGHVLYEDINDIFSFEDCGVTNAAIREVGEELKGYSPHNCILTRVIHDCTSTEGYKHLGIVLESLLPPKFNYNKYRKELSINGIKLLTPVQLWENFHLFEYWSQLIIRDFFGAYRPRIISTISPLKQPKNSKNIILVGEIASGKTSILEHIAKLKGFGYVSASKCLVEILKIDYQENRNRIYFQEQALKFIETKEGPNRLARQITRKIGRKKITLIDGIRNLSTIKELKAILGDCILVYIDSPRDKALENYKFRSGDAFVNDNFVKAREHKTEQELPFILEEADAVLFNADSLQNTIQIFSDWILNPRDDEFLR